LTTSSAKPGGGRFAFRVVVFKTRVGRQQRRRRDAVAREDADPSAVAWSVL
jgi:hypothetical protein